MIDREHVLVLVEDPGACNYLCGVPSALLAAGVRATLVASGVAASYLKARGIECIALTDGTNAETVLDTFEPQLVIVGTAASPAALALEVTRLCRTRCIPTIAAVDMIMNADKRFRGFTDDALAFAPDYLFVPDAACKLAYTLLGFPEKNVVIAGHPHFDSLHEQARELLPRRDSLRQALFPQASQDQLIITFACEPDDPTKADVKERPSDYTLVGRQQTGQRTAIVLEEVLDAFRSMARRPYFVARLHPKMSANSLHKYRTEIDYCSTVENPLEVLAASDLVIGMTSMLLQEAAILGKHTVSVLPTEQERDWVPAVKAGVVPAVTTRQALRQFLQGFAPNHEDPRSTPVFVEGALPTITKFVQQKLRDHSSVTRS